MNSPTLSLNLVVAQFSAMTAKGSTMGLQSDLQGDDLKITGQGFSISFDKKSGLLSSYSKGGETVLASPLKYSFWRPFTDNDKLPIKSNKLKGIWRQATEGQKLNSFNVKEFGNSIVITSSLSFPKVKSSVTATYQIYNDGQIKVSNEFDLSKAGKAGSPHRIGMVTEMPAQYDQFSWFGRGPNETYIDRNYERIGLFESTVDEQWVDYSRPQENGNKVDLRWMSLQSEEGKGITFAGFGSKLSGSARFYSLEAIEKAKYSFELERSPNVVVNIDAIQMGVGGNDSWGSTALKPYMLNSKKYSYSFIIR